MVLAVEGQQLERRRGVEGDVERILHELVDGELRVAHRERRAGGESRGERHGRGVELGGRHHVVHEPDALGLGGGERVARQQVLLGARRADGERPDRGATVAGDDPDLHVRITDRRRVGHEDDVAEERDRRTEAHGVTVHRRHYRHLDVEQIPDELLGVAPERLEPPWLLEGGKPGEVAAGREGAAAPREQDGARVVLALEACEECRQVTVQTAVDGVQRARRMVNGHPEHLTHAREAERREVVAAHSVEVSASRPKRIRPVTSSVAGATIMCCVTTWMSRSCRCSGLVAYTAVPPPAWYMRSTVRAAVMVTCVAASRTSARWRTSRRPSPVAACHASSTASSTNARAARSAASASASCAWTPGRSARTRRLPVGALPVARCTR